MDSEQRAGKLVAWIKEKVNAAGCGGVVLGLSGGLDSSVLAALCVRAFPDTVLGVIMPCHSIDTDKAHAGIVAELLGIPVMEVPLDSAYDAMTQLLPDYQPDPAIGNLARANLKARLRMVTLYYIANQLKYVVTGSGNRSELTVGYFTKHGDSGVDILPLGNLVKAEVRELAEYLKIPREIIDKPPSAGLWDGQTDEAEMGFSYEILDSYILTGNAPLEIKNRIDSMRAASRHKCNTPPIPDF